MLYNTLLLASVAVASVAVAWFLAIMEDYIEHLRTSSKESECLATSENTQHSTLTSADSVTSPQQIKRYQILEDIYNEDL